MTKKKWHLYVVHHSHTDIGYTDLQEKIIYNHVDYIRAAIKLVKDGYANNTVNQKFKWNCETYYCVEQFLLEATEDEKKDFFDLVKKGNIGLSATYLNFNDLVDKAVLDKRTREMVEIFADQGIKANVAMNADVNGISLGNLDVYLDNNVEFFYTNIHCHHGMYPLYQNQKPYFWENAAGKKLLVWSGEHYNLGNALGILYNKNVNFMTENYFGKSNKEEHLDTLKRNIDTYIQQCVDNGYDYDFIPTSVSGVFSDNAPPNPEIIKTLEAFNQKFGDEVVMEMVTVAELYEKIKDKVTTAKTYRGDLTDWWAHGVGSTPYAVKHYKEAQRIHALCQRLDPDKKVMRKDFERETEDNMLLYAEHTWGHSATITNPYDTMVQNLDIRNTSYASKAHEGAAKNLNRILHSKGDKLRYYDRDGRIKAINVGNQNAAQLVEFYIEVYGYGDVEVANEATGEVMVTQISSHPRGVLISFVDHFAPHEEKFYGFKELPAKVEVANTRVAYVGSERIKDIVNTYDPVSYTLPYAIENNFFKIAYEMGKGVTSFYNKVEDCEMLMEGDAKFFVPVYENTAIRTDVYEERRILGRNIRGLHATKHFGQLKEIKLLDQGKVFTQVELVYDLEGTYFSSVVIKLFHDLPRIDFKYKVAKTLSEDIESLFLPLALNLPGTTRYVDKSDVAFRPGIDQLPGTCMEYYLADNGIVYEGKKNSILIQLLDTPLVYMGELKHHPILLCDNKAENNSRDIYSWIMNNAWETNFKMDLSGFTEYCYSLNLVPTVNVESSYKRMKDEHFGVVTFMTE